MGRVPAGWHPARDGSGNAKLPVLSEKIQVRSSRRFNSGPAAEFFYGIICHSIRNNDAVFHGASYFCKIHPHPCPPPSRGRICMNLIKNISHPLVRGVRGGELNHYLFFHTEKIFISFYYLRSFNF